MILTVSTTYVPPCVHPLILSLLVARLEQQRIMERSMSLVSAWESLNPRCIRACTHDRTASSEHIGLFGRESEYVSLPF